MAEKKLARYVTVAGSTYGPDDDLPKDVADQIDNPKAFEERDDATPAEKAAQEQSKKALDSNLKPSGGK